MAQTFLGTARMNRGSKLLLGSALAFGMAVGTAHAADVAIKETGSTLLYPLFQQRGRLTTRRAMRG